jgi:anti-sigma factor RsiW
MATCVDYGAMVQLYLDDELTGSDQREFLAHLENCADCKRQLEELRTLSRRIRQARPQVSAPASLRKRILEQAAHAEKAGASKEEEPAAGPRTRKPAGKWTSPKLSWLPIAIAAMVCLAAGASLSIPHLRREANAASFIDTAIVAHRSLANASMPLDVQTGSTKAVATWFASRVPFNFRVPNAGIASDDTARYVLTGGRLLTFGGEQAALLAFQMPNDTVSVLIAPANKAPAMGGKVTQSSGIGFHSMERDDLHVVTWENKDLVYALTFSNKMPAQHNCSSCHDAAKPSGSALLEEPR